MITTWPYADLLLLRKQFQQHLISCFKSLCYYPDAGLFLLKVSMLWESHTNREIFSLRKLRGESHSPLLFHLEKNKNLIFIICASSVCVNKAAFKASGNWIRSSGAHEYLKFTAEQHEEQEEEQDGAWIRKQDSKSAHFPLTCNRSKQRRNGDLSQKNRLFLSYLWTVLNSWLIVSGSVKCLCCGVSHRHSKRRAQREMENDALTEYSP